MDEVEGRDPRHDAKSGEPADRPEPDAERGRKDGAAPDIPVEPAVTAPLDEVTDEERRMEPAGVMPGGGPDERGEEPTAPGPEEHTGDPAAGDDGGAEDAETRHAD